MRPLKAGHGVGDLVGVRSELPSVPPQLVGEAIQESLEVFFGAIVYDGVEDGDGAECHEPYSPFRCRLLLLPHSAYFCPVASLSSLSVLDPFTSLCGFFDRIRDGIPAPSAAFRLFLLLLRYSFLFRGTLFVIVIIFISMGSRPLCMEFHTQHPGFVPPFGVGPQKKIRTVA